MIFNGLYLKSRLMQGLMPRLSHDVMIWSCVDGIVLMEWKCDVLRTAYILAEKSSSLSFSALCLTSCIYICTYLSVQLDLSATTPVGPAS